MRPLSFQATIVQNVIDEGSQTPYDIWYSCHHVSVLLLLLLSYYLSNAHSHAHTHIRRCTLASAVQNGWIIIPAIVVPFSHCSQTTFEPTHDVSVRRVVLRWPYTFYNSPLFQDKGVQLFIDLIWDHKGTSILPICSLSEDYSSATSIPFHFSLLHKLVTKGPFQ